MQLTLESGSPKDYSDRLTKEQRCYKLLDDLKDKISNLTQKIFELNDEAIQSLNRNLTIEKPTNKNFAKSLIKELFQ